jgi:hypothetical protein
VLEILDLPDPDITPASSRTQLRMECEAKDFSDEHYLADRVYRNDIDELITFVAVWEQYHVRGISGKGLIQCCIFFTVTHFILMLLVSFVFICLPF